MSQSTIYGYFSTDLIAEKKTVTELSRSTGARIVMIARKVVGKTVYCEITALAPAK